MIGFIVDDARVNKESSMRYQEVNVTLSSATFSRLERGTPFNKGRAAEHAIEVIRVAVLAMYPPRTPEEWKDRSRYQGTGRYMLLLWYDLVCYALRRLMGKGDKLGSFTNHVSDQPTHVTLKIPIDLMSWIEKIARSRQSTISEATVHAIEYGHRVLDSQGGADGAERLRRVWRDIFHAIRKRFVS